MIALERRGVYVGTGSACAASRMTESHVLAAVGAPHEVAQGSLRLTLGTPTTSEDVAYAAEQIIEVVRGECVRLGISLEGEGSSAASSNVPRPSAPSATKEAAHE